MRREIHYRPSQGQSPKLRDIPVREQWEWMNRFFTRCTDSKPLAMGATLHIFVRQATERRPLFETAIAEATRRFGQPKTEPDVLDRGDIAWEWEVTPRLIESAIDFLAQGEPWTLHNARPASLTYTASFKLRDPVSGAILPRQTWRARSSLRALSKIIGGIGPDPWLYPHFIFPFSSVNQQFLKYLAAFSAELPFRLAPRHFRSVRQATNDAREHIGFLSPEDDDRIRQAQRPTRNQVPRRHGAA